MFPLTISSYFWAGYQVVCQTIRCRYYEQILQNLLPAATVAVYRKSTRLETEKLDSISSSSNIVEFEDDFVQFHNFHSVKEINLCNWKCYTSNFLKQDSANTVQNMYVVVETQHVADENLKEKHPGLKVHVFALGQPVAWKGTDHFDVIVSCDLPALVQMIDAFGQNLLHLDEEFKIKGLATIQARGLPESLCESGGPRCELTTSPENIDKNTKSEGSEAAITKGYLTSRLSKFLPHDVASSKSATKLSSAEDRNESPQADMKKRATKPPNILVYCGSDDNSGQIYTAVKSSLNLCVNTDVYIIYHLTHIEMLTSPWVENTMLLLLSSCPQLSPEVERKVEDFVLKKNGCLLSFNTSVESCFAQKIIDSNKTVSPLFTFQLDDSHRVTCLRDNSYYFASQGVSKTIVSDEDGCRVEDLPPVDVNNDSQQRALILKTELDNGGVVVLSQLVLERDPAHSAVDSTTFVTLKSSNTARLAALKHVLASMGMDVSPRATPELTPCCLLSQKQELRRKFLSSIHRKLDKESVLRSQNLSLALLEKVNGSEVLPDFLPVITAENNIDNRWLKGFAEQDYWSNLDTDKMGQIVLYTDVISTTMPVFDGMLFSLPQGLSPVAIAGRQTSGRGRGGNMWLSPRGCAMFTFPVSFDIDSEIGQRISFLQHLVSTAVVHGIRTLPGYQNLNLRLKWPNDIYYGKDMKLGGVIVTSTVMGSTVYSTIGCGVNVANSDPTICINDIIELSNRSRKASGDSEMDVYTGSIPLLSPGGVIARTLSVLEKLLAQFEKHGHTHFCEIYYKYWLHSGVKVSLNLEADNGHGEGEIVGLDEYGFLSVRKSSGETVSVQPDGNSFDMMQNLVYCKRR